jgi:hypothetical protein
MDIVLRLGLRRPLQQYQDDRRQQRYLDNGEGLSGLWVQIAGMFVFTFNNSETIYAGNLASKSITGVSTTFSGLNGCFYMLQQGVPIAFAEARAATKRNSEGIS